MKPELTDLDIDLPAEPEEEYQSLVRTLAWTTGFGLIFVRCSPAAGEELIIQIRDDISDKKIEVLRLEQQIENLYPIIENLPNREQIDILFVTGLEKSFVESIKSGYGGQGDYYKLDTVPRILGHLNLQRERFRDNFNICFVFILPLFGLKYFIRRSPDFFDWRSGVFEFPTKQELLGQESSRILQEGNYKEYCALTPEEQVKKVLEIQELLAEKHQQPSEKARLQFELGNLLAAAKEYEAAIASYDQAILFKADDHEAWNNRGLALRNLGRYEEAIASYDQALRIQPDKYVSWDERGIALRNLGRYEEAIASYDQALRIQPDNYYAWNDRGLALDNLGRYEEAIANYDKAISIQPNFEWSWNNRGMALSKLGRYEEALSNYEQALKLQPDYYYAWDNRGTALWNLGRYEEAIASYDKGLKIKPDDHQAWYNRGIALGNLGRYEEEIASYDQALHFKPDDHEAWYNRGIALRKLGRYEEAIASYDQALHFKPDDHEAWYNRGYALYSLGRLEEANTSYDKALELKPNEYWVYFWRGNALLNVGLYEEALSSYDTTIDIIIKEKLGRHNWYWSVGRAVLEFKSDPSYCAWCGRAISLHKLGRHREAFTSYKKVFINPNIYQDGYTLIKAIAQRKLRWRELIKDLLQFLEASGFKR